MSRSTVYVGNIYSNATDEQVKQLLETIGPLVRWEPKRDGEVKFSAIAEYADHYTAEIAVRNLNGYKFQNRDLKVKLHGASHATPQQTHYPTFDQVERGQFNMEEFFSKLSAEKKLSILYELKMIFSGKDQHKLYQLLLEKPIFTQTLMKALEEVNRKYPQQRIQEQYQMHPPVFQQPQPEQFFQGFPYQQPQPQPQPQPQQQAYMYQYMFPRKTQ